MMMIKFRNDEGKDLIKKLKKMHKFTKELIECVEDKYEDDEEEDYRYDDEYDEGMNHRNASRTRYRRSM